MPRQLTSRRIPLVALLLALSLLAGCQTPLLPLGDPIGEIEPGSALIGCDQAAAPIVLDHDATMLALVTFVNPVERDVTIRIPSERLNTTPKTTP